MQAVNRRTFLKIAGFGGVVFASRLARGAAAYASQDEFFFVQLSDTHWGYQGAANPDALVTLAKADLDKQGRDARIVVLTHRPLFPLYPQWDWATRDGERAIELLMPYRNVTVFYGHIHQEHHYKTAHIEHHAARSLIFPLPAPGSAPKREPLKWDAAQPYRGLGFRQVAAEAEPVEYKISEFPVVPNA